MCSLWIEIETGGTLKIKGNPQHPFTQGFTCAKLHKFQNRLRSPKRITKPLLKMNDRFRPVSWDQALDKCAEQIQKLRREPLSILHIPGDAAKGVLQLVPKYFFAVLGSSRISGSLCDNAGIQACIEDFGSLETNDITDIVNAQAIVNWGKDLHRSSVHTAALVSRARRNGTKVLTISPGGDSNEPLSDWTVRIRPGTDRFLAAAVLRLFVERNRLEQSAIDRTANWELFRQLIERHSFEELIVRCDASKEEVELVYSCYAHRKPVSTMLGWGLQRYLHGAENVRFINALAVLTGNLGKKGGGAYFNISSMRNFNVFLSAPAQSDKRRALLLPAIGREILHAADPPVKMIWVNGSNVVNQAPESGLTAQAFAQVPFKVVVDAFLTDTAQLADLVLPCALMFERDDIIGSFLHDYIGYARKIVDPPGEARTDLQIMTELGKRLDPPIPIPDMDHCLSTALASPYLDISLEALRERGFARAKRASIAYAGFQFDHPDGRYRLPTALHEEPPPPTDYPLRLLTLIRKNATHSQILPDQQKIPPTVRIAEDNPILKSLHLDRPVFLVSPLGSLQVEIRTARDLHPEAAIYRRGDWMKCGGGVNQLIAAQTTDLGDGTAYYSQYVRLEN